MIRVAQPADVERLLELFMEHAAFERATPVVRANAENLSAALFAADPRLHAWVALDQNVIVGYTTVTEDYSTWKAARFLSMDCLFVRPGYRNGGLGASLLGAVVHFARARGLPEVQWQTPVWNADARRFYERQGAIGCEKMRFSLGVS